MSTSPRSVMLVGASGNIGVYVLTQLLKHPQPPQISILTRNSSTAEFPQGVNVVRTDYSRESLEHAFKGQNAVLSFLNYDVSVNQKLLIDVAIDAGVDRFIPSDYGIRTYHEQYTVGVARYKREIVEYLETKEDQISWTSFICNPWIEYCLLDGLLGFDLKAREVGIIDNGDTPFSGSIRPYVAQAVCNLLVDPAAFQDSKNQYVHLEGHSLTQNKILSIIEKLSGEKWKVNHVRAKDLISEGRELITAGNPWGMALVVRAVTCARGEQDEAVGDLRSLDPWDARLGLKLNDLEDDLRHTLEGKYPTIHMPPVIIP